jgi:hypothetical protein
MSGQQRQSHRPSSWAILSTSALNSKGPLASTCPCARLQLIKFLAVGLHWDAVCSSDHAKGKLTSMFIPNTTLMRA